MTAATLEIVKCAELLEIDPLALPKVSDSLSAEYPTQFETSTSGQSLTTLLSYAYEFKIRAKSDQNLSQADMCKKMSAFSVVCST